MQLGRFQVSTLRPPPILSVDFNQDGRLFTVASETGYEVWKTWPLQLIRRRGELNRMMCLRELIKSASRDPCSSPDIAWLTFDGFARRWQGAAVPAQ